MKVIFSRVPSIAVLVIVALGAVRLSIAASAQTASTVNLNPGDNLSEAVNAAPEGTTFLFAPGVYRRQSIQPKNGDTFSGSTQGAVVLNGSSVLSFQRDSAGSGLWVAKATSDNNWVGLCEDTSPLCGYDQDLFVDSVLQTPSQSPIDLKAGQWYFDRVNDIVYLKANPGGHTVEMATTNFAFYGTASNVEIDHITVEKYATPALQGTIGGNFFELGSNWVVNVVEARLNHGGAIVLGNASQITNSFVHNNGQIGIKFYFCTGCIASNNELSWNNTDGFSQVWESGATKFWSTTNLVVKGNYVHDNYGKGLWTDTDNYNTLYYNNTVTNNFNVGLQHEVSYAMTVRNNIFRGNNPGPGSWSGFGQIRVMSSSHADIHDNTIEVAGTGGHGISVDNITRGIGAMGPWVAANNYIHNNTITYMGANGLSGYENDSAGNTAGVGNRFDYNTYVAANCAPNHWVWQTNVPISWQELQAQGQETHGVYSILPVATGAIKPLLTLSPTSFEFANTVVGTIQTFKKITITNTGTAPLVVCSIQTTGQNAASFSIPAGHQNCGSVAVGGSCTFDVGFTPASVGNFSASVSITSNTIASPQSVTVSGVGVAPVVPIATISPGRAVFSSTTVGSTAAYQKITITNTGSANLTISSISTSGADASSFTIPANHQNCNKALIPGASCTFDVAFTPKAVGALAGSIVINDNESTSPDTMSVTGTGLAR